MNLDLGAGSNHASCQLSGIFNGLNEIDASGHCGSVGREGRKFGRQIAAAESRGLDGADKL